MSELEEIEKRLRNALPDDKWTTPTEAALYYDFLSHAKEDIDYLLFLVKRYEQEKLYWNCSTHGQSQNAWGCPECVRELRESLRWYRKGIEKHRDRGSFGKVRPMDRELYKLLEMEGGKEQ